MSHSEEITSILSEISKLAGVGEIEYKDGRIFWECKNLLATFLIHGKSQRRHHVVVREVSRQEVTRIVELIGNYPEFRRSIDFRWRPKI